MAQARRRDLPIGSVRTCPDEQALLLARRAAEAIAGEALNLSSWRFHQAVNALLDLPLENRHCLVHLETLRTQRRLRVYARTGHRAAQSGEQEMTLAREPS